MLQKSKTDRRSRNILSRIPTFTTSIATPYMRKSGLQKSKKTLPPPPPLEKVSQAAKDALAALDAAIIKAQRIEKRASLLNYRDPALRDVFGDLDDAIQDIGDCIGEIEFVGGLKPKPSFTAKDKLYFKHEMKSRKFKTDVITINYITNIENYEKRVRDKKEKIAQDLEKIDKSLVNMRRIFKDFWVKFNDPDFSKDKLQTMLFDMEIQVDKVSGAISVFRFSGGSSLFTASERKTILEQLDVYTGRKKYFSREIRNAREILSHTQKI